MAKNIFWGRTTHEDETLLSLLTFQPATNAGGHNAHI